MGLQLLLIAQLLLTTSHVRLQNHERQERKFNHRMERRELNLETRKRRIDHRFRKRDLRFKKRELRFQRRELRWKRRTHQE